MTKEEYLHMVDMALYAIEQGFHVEYAGNGALFVQLPINFEIGQKN